MTSIVKARGLKKSYGKFEALRSVNFDVERGRIVGLIGPNGAGKTTILKAILGLTSFDGELEIFGLDPQKDRHKLMQKVCFIADVAVLPRWIKVSQALSYVEGVHPGFNRSKAESFLAKTKIPLDKKVGHLSKGMTTQLHLSLVLAIEAELLVLDEPTLGLDILYRKDFYQELLTEFFDENRSILVTTHQVEEIENLLTDVVFIKDGELVLNATMDDVSERFVEVMVAKENLEQALQHNPISRREVFGRTVLLFDGLSMEVAETLGEIHRPSISDLFVAKMRGGDEA
ncbi:ABC transporter ATP-binding protein [Pleionea sp. CnH1-48]|uniref:ABC transporter ATP-binding protein n=1 Tax=Pleionea sp. CnH1-48 TaxID=2954494 RepID=UPI0020969F36|nr:ABC transporter ATP-binding protein [Pleionea sp. CnH1-48]MCO7227246.1 ABC transporter ATP-binding protein [Pleionea sp. CnH1-48]